MINIHRFVDELPRKQRFYDKSKFLSYELARLSASKFLEDPSLLERGREFMERHMRPDPCQAEYYEIWSDLLRRDPQEIARLLLSDTPDGDLLRDTMPVFYVPTYDERLSVLSRSRDGDCEIMNGYRA